jgi:hypothetical protein
MLPWAATACGRASSTIGFLSDGGVVSIRELGGSESTRRKKKELKLRWISRASLASGLRQAAREALDFIPDHLVYRDKLSFRNIYIALVFVLD